VGSQTVRLVPGTLAAESPRQECMATLEREAAAYWSRLTPEQEAWALRKMGFPAMGIILSPLATRCGHASRV
jgi:hypothetical protein